MPGTVLRTEQNTGKPMDELVIEPALWGTPSLLLGVHTSLRFKAARQKEEIMGCGNVRGELKGRWRRGAWVAQ